MRGAGVLTPRPIGLITGYVVTRFRCIVEPLLLKPKQAAIRLATDSLRSQQMGQCLKDQYECLATPIPPHLAALVEQLKKQK
jgi:hypothetical protein